MGVGNVGGKVAMVEYWYSDFGSIAVYWCW